MGQDSARPEFWDTRFSSGATPWDAHRVPPRLERWLATRSSPQRVLIPGCGSGYEARLFAERGHDVLAIDFSDAALEAARRELGPLATRLRKADFFALQEPAFDLVYERAFLCALPRARWPDWGRRMAELVRPGGELVGFFYFDDNERGPPFGASENTLNALLQDAFKPVENRPVPALESIPVFRGKESWQVWKRKL
jgi:SAM-dependent methyltransferase